METEHSKAEGVRKKRSQLLSCYREREVSHVFPAEDRAALDAVDVAHRMRARGHLALAGLAFFDVDTGGASEGRLSAQ